jgi:hypothetical protein
LLCNWGIIHVLDTLPRGDERNNKQLIEILPGLHYLSSIILLFSIQDRSIEKQVDFQEIERKKESMVLLHISCEKEQDNYFLQLD